MGRFKVAVLLGAEPYQVYHVASIAWELSERPGLAVEIVATLAETLAEFEALARSVGAKPLPTRLLHTPLHVRLLQRLALFGALKTAIMKHAANRKILSQYAAIVTPTDHAGALRAHLNPRPLMVYVNHGVGGRAASYSDKYLNFDFIIVASPKDERRLLEEHLVRPGHYAVAYPKLELARDLARTRGPGLTSDRPIVLFNPHSKRSLRSWERFARPLIAHAAATGEFALIVAPHTKLFRRRPRFAWRRWERLAVPGRVIIDLGSQRSLDMTYTAAADIYVGDVSSQVFEFLTRPKPCVFLNAHKVAWRGQKDFASWELGDVAETPDEAIAAICNAQSRHHLYQERQLKHIEGAINGQPHAARRAADAIAGCLASAKPTGEVMFAVSDLGTGGTGRATMLTVNGLAKRGTDVALVVMRRGGILERDLDPSVKFLPLNAGANRGPGMLLALPRLVRRIRAERPSQIVSSGNHMHVLATLAHALARVPGCKLALKMTNPVEKPGDSGLSAVVRRAWYRWAFQQADKILVITDAAKAELAGRLPGIAKKLVVVDNPYITPAMLEAGGRRNRREPGKLIAIGRLARQKNYPLLLDALALIKDRAWTIDILGDGPLLRTLCQQAEQLGIADRVHFRGFVPDPLPYLTSARALILSSSWEGQGAVLLEALACGCPVVATRSTSAVAGVLANGRFGRLVPAGDSAALAQAISLELQAQTKLPPAARDYVVRFRIDEGVASHARALGIPLRSPKRPPVRRNAAV
jgi:glycosyltransferase involved in cell wall biosynthesis